jgi:hypothetical protein
MHYLFIKNGIASRETVAVSFHLSGAIAFCRFQASYCFVEKTFLKYLGQTVLSDRILLVNVGKIIIQGLCRYFKTDTY